jgi:hypothetical protein
MHVDDYLQQQDEMLHQQQQAALQLNLEGRSLELFSPDNWLRQQVARLISNKHFESFILVLICVSSISLALDTPTLDPNSGLKKALGVLDTIFAIAFLLEALMKILVKGFVNNGPGSYLKSPWNILDFVIVIVGKF